MVKRTSEKEEGIVVQTKKIRVAIGAKMLVNTTTVKVTSGDRKSPPTDALTANKLGSLTGAWRSRVLVATAARTTKVFAKRESIGYRKARLKVTLFTWMVVVVKTVQIVGTETTNPIASDREPFPVFRSEVLIAPTVTPTKTRRRMTVLWVLLRHGVVLLDVHGGRENTTRTRVTLTRFVPESAERVWNAPPLLFANLSVPVTRQVVVSLVRRRATLVGKRTVAVVLGWHKHTSQKTKVGRIIWAISPVQAPRLSPNPELTN